MPDLVAPASPKPIIRSMKKKWYKKWWGILLISVLVGVIALLIWFIYLVIDVMATAQRGEFDSRLFNPSKKAPYQMSEIIDLTDPILGSKNAPIQIVEFGDILCPICQKSYPVIRELSIKYPEKIAFYWRNFPVISEESIKLAHAGECAHLQNKFWPLHDRLFQLQDMVDSAGLPQIATQVGLDQKMFQDCLNNNNILIKIQDDYELALEVEAHGTPTFIVNGYKLQGHLPMEIWEEIISKLQ